MEFLEHNIKSLEKVDIDHLLDYLLFAYDRTCDANNNEQAARWYEVMKQIRAEIWKRAK